MALDPGTRRVGVAISDPSRTLASPCEVIDRRAVSAPERVAELCRTFDVDAVIVGLPVTLGGGEGLSAVDARALGEEVAATTGLDVVYYDERFTTTIAERALLEAGMRRRRRRDVRDKIAATVLLQDYLNRQRPS